MPSTAVETTFGGGRRPSGQNISAHTVGVALRVTLLVLIAGLVYLATGDPVQLTWIGLLAIASIPAVFAPNQRFAAPLGRLAEVVLVGLAASSVAVAADASGSVSSGVGAAAVLPFLAVPLTAATFQERPLESAGLLSLAATTLTVAGWFTKSAGMTQLGQVGYLGVCAQWLTLSAIGAITAGAMQRAMLARRAPQPYAEATRLLTQLRQVARQLPGATLDPGSIAEHLLEELRSIGRADRSAVFAASGGGRLEVLAQNGVEGDASTRAVWETHLDADSAIADAWASQQPQVAGRTQLRTHGSLANDPVSALVVPLVAGVRTVGLVVLERDGVGGYPPNLTNRIISTAAPAALRLEAALLFDEVRSLATNEERQRLAREIHDGVAQELAMIGYGIDNAQAGLPDNVEQTAADLQELRGEVTRVITELRLSLFELRTEVDRHGGLTAAIAEFARISGNQAGLKVHLSLDETGRLPASVESELLRIAQEAITNARKHAFAANLWVVCSIDPPFASIEVSDDGQGLSDQRNQGSYGLAIMAERAERIRGRLEIRPREPSGTTVAVVIGGTTRQETRTTR
ncbi:GAF domain-containing sensor histidine kinase [Allorhizocola rhizosphaerae]|uniref:sensor histidine kinase n=1 Tax=Allorhizocola rhizosphaerae TaxID=1872709 RepID=UPI000E3D4CF4|nr:GAF domain-containing sensor histidine kinase [Allorhizocola rhizosphaerae]